ncbi:HNH endonuclease [Nocardioides KLBMP 9356]|uniref:HNH endonuclease n=1 Tax=Nocardioides potassii TaxID=2911371 RepID=A0ABS9HFR0_9ACTN|nr:HNH endonuclease signature motif containing protein [Nocardioides potassii]MCF6379069.1 HNH endonuclease [Nocardioides potassii]
MIDALAGPGAGEADALTASDLLALIRDRKTAEDRAAADLLDLAARWADLHPPESIHAAAAFEVRGSEHEEPIAGDGCPLVAEFCVAELGTVLGISTTAAKKLIGHALELRHRLPRLWTQVQSGVVPAWRARLVAETTIHTTPTLTPEAAAHVDGQVAAVAGRIGAVQLERLVAETIKRFDLATPDAAADPEDGYLHVDPRHVTLHDDDVHFAGTMRWEAELGIADSLDLDRAVAHGAELRKAMGSTASLDVRRAEALGDLARTQTALDLAFARSGGGFEARSARTSTTDMDGRVAGEERAGVSRPDLPAARQVVLHVHFDAVVVGEQTVFGPTGRLEERHKLLLLDQLTSWCGDSRTTITVKPVTDLNANLTAPGYDIPDRIREQVILRDQTCVFPWCTRPARRCDIDHVIAYDHDAEAEGRPQPGPTATWNLAPLCRHHHRLKTHTAWRYDMTANGVFEWTSPHGHRYRRDHTGTTPIELEDGPDRTHDGPPGIPRPRRR